MVNPISLMTLVAVLAALPVDQIYRTGSRRPIKGKVLSESSTEVKYLPTGISQPQTIKAAEVEDIEYEDTPEAYRQGLSYLEAGDTTNAISSLKAAAGAKTRGDWVKVYSAYHLGQAYYQAGARDPSQYVKAAETFEQLLKDAPDCRFLAPALKRWGEALARARNPDRAAEVFDQLAREAETRKLGLLWEARAKILKAEAYELNDQAAQAKTAFQAAGSFAKANADQLGDTDPVKQELLSIAGRAQLSEGVTMLKDGKYADARRAFERIAQDPNASPVVVAAAECGLGQVHLEEGNLAEALDQFARVRVRHFLIEEVAAQATYYLGKTCLALKDQEPAGQRKAREYFAEVTERYKETSWADLARAELR